MSSALTISALWYMETDVLQYILQYGKEKGS